MTIIAIDLDGVLVEWNQTFRTYLLEAGADIPAFIEPPCWHWARYFGATTPEISAAQTRMTKEHRTFWRALPPHADTTHADVERLLCDLVTEHEVTFVTARPAGRADAMAWLKQHFLLPDPLHVVLARVDKSSILFGMGVEVVIEDRWENLVSLRERGSTARLLLVDRPYNHQAIHEDAVYGITRCRHTAAALHVAKELSCADRT